MSESPVIRYIGVDLATEPSWSALQIVNGQTGDVVYSTRISDRPRILINGVHIPPTNCTIIPIDDELIDTTAVARLLLRKLNP